LTATEVTPAQTSRLLEIRLDGVYQLIWSAKLPARKQDGRWWIPLDAVRARLEKVARAGRGQKDAGSAGVGILNEPGRE
jgi:hypothetical protein